MVDWMMGPTEAVHLTGSATHSINHPHQRLHYSQPKHTKFGDDLRGARDIPCSLVENVWGLAPHCKAGMCYVGPGHTPHSTWRSNDKEPSP